MNPEDEDIALVDRARKILTMGPSWSVREFIEDILWHGYGTSFETIHFQRCKLQELVVLYGV